MQKLTDYISDLLLLYDCVIIPDFGGFVCNYKGACIDEQNGKIHPPTKEIAFNRNLKYNDGLLISWIARRENISYEKATRLSAIYSQELKQKLNEQSEFVFGKVGVFRTDRYLNTTFISGGENFLADSMGMDSISILSKQKHKSTPTVETPKPQAHKLRRYTLAIAGAIALLIGLHVGFIYQDTPNYIGNISTQTSSVKPELPDFLSGKTKRNKTKVSPDYDYVEYDASHELTTL